MHTSDISDDAVTSGKVENGSLQDGDFAAGVLPGATQVRTKVEAVPMTCTETSPAPGTFFVSCSGQSTITVSCEAGENATGGGYGTPQPSQSAPTSAVAINDTRPEPQAGTPTGWAVKATANGFNTGSSAGVPRPPDPEVSVYAVCST